ncbi:MAG: tyrosine-type recombinase/integrase [Anaerolineae bacterium]
MSSKSLTSQTQSDLVTSPDISADILAGQLAPSSIKMYRRDFQAYLAFAGSLESALRPDTLARWRAHLAAETDLSPNTINRMLSSVKRVVAEAVKQGYIRNPELAEDFAAIDGVKVKALKDRLKPHARTPITAEDMRRLCDAPDTTTMIGLRDRALLHTLASSGMRITEAATLKRSQISQKGKSYVVSIMGKNDIEPRQAPLRREANKYILEWLKARPVESEYVFTSFEGRGERLTAKPLSAVGAWRVVQHYAEAVGLEHIKPHDFRRFVGTELARRDIRQAQKALGHKRIDTTARHYVLDELEPGLTDDLY